MCRGGRTVVRTRTSIRRTMGTVVVGVIVLLGILPTGLASAQGSVPDNGTVIDGNLVWLKIANSFGLMTWNQAMSTTASLKSGHYGLTDGSKAGDWRLPTKDELLKRQKNLQGFTQVANGFYWTSTSNGYNCKNMHLPRVWTVKISNGYPLATYTDEPQLVWPVRNK